jgi:hypothetical protein
MQNTPRHFLNGTPPHIIFFVILFFYAAMQQLTKEKTMFDFEEQYKKVESAVKSGYNFWLDVVVDALKMYKAK